MLNVECLMLMDVDNIDMLMDERWILMDVDNVDDWLWVIQMFLIDVDRRWIWVRDECLWMLIMLMDVGNIDGRCWLYWWWMLIIMICWWMLIILMYIDNVDDGSWWIMINIDIHVDGWLMFLILTMVAGGYDKWRMIEKLMSKIDNEYYRYYVYWRKMDEE